MEPIELHPDFKDFLKLLNVHNVKYLIVGGYAVGFYGYPRATGDIDVWIEVDSKNAERILRALRDFGFSNKELSKELFLKEEKIVRMGVPPVRLEIITSASGVDFADCFKRRVVQKIDTIPVNFISLKDLKENKQKSGRYKDLEDLNHLP